MRVTRDSLTELGAQCQLNVFAAEWPDGVEVSEATLRRATELGLDLTWWAERALPVPIWAEYDRQMALHWAEYDRQMAPHWAEYQRQVALHWAEYQRQVARALWAVLATVT